MKKAGLNGMCKIFLLTITLLFLVVFYIFIITLVSFGESLAINSKGPTTSVSLNNRHAKQDQHLLI